MFEKMHKGEADGTYSPHTTATKKPTLEAMSDVPSDLSAAVQELENIFTISSAKLNSITDHFVEELEKGLTGEGANIPMNVTWVFGFPTGNEEGEYVTLDMGGTNLRVCYVVLTNRRGEYKILQDKCPLPDGLKSGTAEQLWGFVADCTGKFLRENNLVHPGKKEKLPLSFTFSFPVTQANIRSGILQRWTKGFDVDGVEGHDVVPQLEKAFAEKNVPVEIVAVVNDTTGTLIASAYQDPEIKIGSIFSTGVNAAYMERFKAIPKIRSHNLPDDTEIAINTEYGAFDNDKKVLPRTRFDDQIDQESARPGQQLYEKMVAGLYVGELLRCVFLELHHRGLLFRGRDITAVQEKSGLDSAFMSTVEQNNTKSMAGIAEECKRLFGFEPELYELEVIRFLTKLIATRAARLYACGIAAVARKQGLERCHVGVDGSVFHCYAHFQERAAQALKEIMDWPEEDPQRITLVSAQDGSGVGAALIAALALRRSQ